MKGGPRRWYNQMEEEKKKRKRKKKQLGRLFGRFNAFKARPSSLVMHFLGDRRVYIAKKEARDVYHVRDPNAA